jgi:hypothetical protein
MPQALVIGINQYAASEVPPLRCAVNDAEEMGRRLKDAGFDVVILTDGAATRQNIHKELEIGLNRRTADEDDPVVVYWAGHGMTDLNKPANGGGWSTFLVPHDAKIDEPKGTALAVEHVWAVLDGLKTRRLLVLLDTCFSGAFADSKRGFAVGGRGAPMLTDDFLRIGGHGRVVISACGPNEVAREDLDAGHGHLTKALLSVMENRSANGDRTIPITTLTTNVLDAVRRETNRAQTPFADLSSQGPDWVIPLPPAAHYRAPLPGWAFVGTSGGVGKTTLAMVTAELLAEAGHKVLYLDADIAHFGATSEWCQRAHTDVGRVRTFADHVSMFSRTKSTMRPGVLVDNLLNVTPEYLRRNGCGEILLLPAVRSSDRVFAFELVADIKDRRSNAVCQQILDATFERGVREGATCVVIDCGAQFDPLAVNCLTAAHHPFIVAAARAGAKRQRDIVLSNCAQTIEHFEEVAVETVVNRVPSQAALKEHWGITGPGTGLHYLPFDPQLFRDWEEGRPNFELGYDELSSQWHKILVASDRNSCNGDHRSMLPEEWDRFSKWALWIVERPEWMAEEDRSLRRRLRKNIIGSTVLFGLTVAGGLELFLGMGDPGRPAWLTVLLAIGTGICGLWTLGLGLVIRGVRRRRRIISEVKRYQSSAEQLKKWFSAPTKDVPWWKVWKSSRKAAIEWLHGRILKARTDEMAAHRADMA